MKTATLRVVSLVLVLAFAFALSACGDLFSTVDYPSVDNLRQSIEMKANPEGKTCRFTVESTIPDGAQGFIAQQGEFNFCFSSDPGIAVGNTVVVKISSITRQTDAFYVYCSKV